MEIVDNAPEMDVTSPEFTDMLAKIAPKGDPKPEVKETKTDVKPEDTASSAKVDETKEDTTEAEDDTDETPDKLKARIRGLQAELTRRKGNAEKVSELEVKLAKVEGQLESASRNPKEQENTIDAALKKLDDKGLIEKKVDWNDELTDARTRYASAEERGDNAAMEKQASRILYAKKVLSAIEFETSDRRERKQTEAEQLRDSQSKVKAELDGMYEALTENFPDFNNKESELWKAGDAAYRANPEIMKRMGPAGEVVAAALAILQNPQLVGQRSEAEARQDVVSKLEKGIKRSLQAGASSPTTGRMVTPRIDSGEGLAKFNEMVDRIKGG